MEIKHLKLIKTIVEEGNITNSADKLFLTRSALSHQLRELEERLGLKVFIRSKNDWKLTKEGETIYSLANKVLAEMELGLKQIKDVREGSRGLIRVNTECYSFYQGLPAFIQKMSMLYPDIEIQLMIETTHHPISKLITNDLDISITTEKPDHKDLKSISLFEDEVLALLPEEHELAEKEFIEPADFSDVHLIIHSYPLETVSVYQNYLKLHHVEPMKITAIPLTEVTLEMVQANMGIMCIPKWALKSFKLPDYLQFKSLGKNGFKRKHYLVYRASDNDKKYIQDFIDNMEEEFTF